MPSLRSKDLICRERVRKTKGPRRLTCRKPRTPASAVSHARRISPISRSSMTAPITAVMIVPTVPPPVERPICGSSQPPISAPTILHDDIADEPKSVTLNDQPGEPTRYCAKKQHDDECLDVHRCLPLRRFEKEPPQHDTPRIVGGGPPVGIYQSLFKKFLRDVPVRCGLCRRAHMPPAPRAVEATKAARPALSTVLRRAIMDFDRRGMTMGGSHEVNRPRRSSSKMA